ncbi:hypothetical protein [Haloarcula pelagica]|uniref:hypothetical protein n=1 Tax=Haloarcula pelagica TaxID=3033389 RepID=UPI0024C319E9|nr:hypothetical protein [Halomicroarcula sp. YJ-61-S]
MTPEPAGSIDRRTLLRTVAGVGGAALAGCPGTAPEPDGPTVQVTDGDGTGTQTDEPDPYLDLVRTYAPTLYFDTDERWFPTDPRPYTSERDGETVVDGFDALDGYHRDYEADDPPAPTVFYNVVAYEESPLVAVQYWFYSAFDQFTTNFHWHDWEVLHVLVDTESGEPQLHVASSHSRRVPNNEFLDPEPEQVPRVLSELGSHSSALSVNDVPDQFQRLPTDGSFADITNSALEGIEDVASVPIAYGLPRDEGSRLPYVIPELDGEPLYEHDRLPNVDRSALVPSELTVRSFADLSEPPSELPRRENGLVFDYSERASSADIDYDLVSTTELEHITDFTGPQLSFEFSVPQAAEDAIAGHITTTGAPWNQPRYENPAADITEPNHRQALSERYDAIGAPAPGTVVFGTVAETVTSPDAPEGSGVTTESTSYEAVALLESDPEAVPTFAGTAVLRDVPPGEHRLTVNAAGTAPHSEPLTVSEGGEPTVAGVDGEIPLVANADATKVTVDPSQADSELTELAIADDFGGRLYDAPLTGPDAVYVHSGGAYTTEVRDADGAVGAARVNPAADATAVAVEQLTTGKASLARFLAAIAEETQTDIVAATDIESGDIDTGDVVDAVGDAVSGGDVTGQANAVRGLTQALSAVASGAQKAANRAESGNRSGADKQLRGVANALEQVGERLSIARSALPDAIVNAADRRLEEATRRAEQAQQQTKL